jgi:hypothetical protein
MPRAVADLETKLEPERVIAALLDFTPRRPEIWSALDRDVYEVYEVGDTSAEIREGNSKRVWAREHYDWSVPGTVTWTVVESPFSTTGDSVSATVEPTATGSLVHVVWRRRGKNVMTKAFVGVIALFIPRLFRSYWRKTLDGIAEGRLPQPTPPGARDA